MKKLTYHRKIGNLEIFTEMDECGRKIYDIFTRHGGPPLLIAQMQQGKTGTAIVVIDLFIQCCEADGIKDYEVIYLTNIADNVLNSQNDDRLTDAGLANKVKIIHHADLRNKKLPVNLSVSRRLLIVDECHLALGKNRPLHKFFKKLGINYGESIDTWKNKENYVLSLSATPYAAQIQSHLNNRAFETVVMPLNPHYYSLKNMEADGRLFQSEQVVRNEAVTSFFELRMMEFVARCNTEGAGFMVVRSTGKGPELLTEFIREKYPDVDVKIFASNPTNNIGSLDNRLSKQPFKPFVAIIRGSLRAGKTLTTTKNIRMWLEPPKSLGDTMCQVVGRCVGFEIENGVNRRRADTFPLYCNTSELKNAIEFFEHQKIAPSGAWNKSTKSVEKYDYAPFVLDVCPETWKSMTPSERWDTIKDKKPDLNPYWTHAHTMTVSENNTEDLAAWISGTGKNPGQSFIGKGCIQVVNANAANPIHKDSWKQVVSKGLDGKVIVMDILNVAKIHSPTAAETKYIPTKEDYEETLRADVMFQT